MSLPEKRTPINLPLIIEGEKQRREKEKRTPINLPLIIEFVGVLFHRGPGYRVYFRQQGDEIILLLCGGNKSTQNKDIELAKQLAKRWRKNDD